jgi:hypothetical protein
MLETRRITVQGQPGGIIRETSSPKWTGGVAQVVECLLCKPKILSLNPNSTKKKKDTMAERKM